MAFMIPEYMHARAWSLETITGRELVFGLSGLASTGEVAREIGLTEADIEEAEYDAKARWYCRLTAPGYMDCTEWSGPFETEDEARESISEQYDVDPDTGEDLPEA